MISDLAREILADMRTAEFANGASITSLASWLGEPRFAIRDALKELLTVGHVYRVKNQFFHIEDRVHAPAGVLHRTEIRAGLKAGKRQIDIARELGVTPQVVHFETPGRRSVM